MANGDATKGIRWLVSEDLILINKKALSFTPYEKFSVNRNILDGAQQRPNTFSYFENCKDVYVLAAQLMISINKAHAFGNGNKRTAFIASVIFLRINGFIFSPQEIEILQFSHDIATKCPLANDPYHLQSWFRHYSTPSKYPIGVRSQLEDLPFTIPTLWRK
ncbi:hypothetical protein GCM10008107_12090 [Psychrosphaera saromensis]|uniref:Fido domain-containing protein n=1 Tax=Psychrosphaera saromensis TaxID=716813 RepID=A0A2S7UVJ4_9GAMM|nr:type II toxin-antitoxin system death-on-curing family toxin [Psychrosphaera saromensis]PQJ53532.1 hypothetical protein BTO11_07535 [Psychrosphaera saromensis]GHB64507.1 hypothetical protein GCM10008107_12090 [Psychrosphaera saromensis]GLQ15712.1 hypothetical protein GCM10007917_31670 [Psychrosphaera saromensis]